MELEYNNKLEGIEQIEINNEMFNPIEALPPVELPSESVEDIAMAEVGEASDLSVEAIDKLESYTDIEQHECLNDAVVTENIAEYLSGVEELKYENWVTLSLEQRRDLLNKIECRIAEIEHRPPLPINVEKMSWNIFGYQSSQNNLIALNSRYVMLDSKEAYHNVIDTIIHEGRHAYQHYNVDKKCIHDSLSVVNTWRENFYDPKYKYYSGSTVVVIGPNKVGNVGYRLYYYQPVEIDARNFASDVMLKLKQKGFLS